MALLIGSTDWSNTPLGPIEAWPQSLKTTVSLCLASNFPINIIWGPEHSQIYNDGYRVVCGAAHPIALGEAYTKTWASAWPAIGQPFDDALAGKTSYLENQRMFLFRNGYLEETFFTFSISPIRDESGGIGGLFHPVTETTPSMLAERRTRLLRDLNARLGDARTTGEVFARAVEVFADHAFDLPFVLIYDLSAGAGAPRLAGFTGLGGGRDAGPGPPFEPGSPWMGTLARLKRPAEFDDIPWEAAARCGPYDEPPGRALVFPIRVPGAAAPVALLLAGASPRLPLNDAYRDFFGLLGAAVAAGVANARTYEEARERAEMLAALDHAKTAFFSNVSHEFRTPLTLMLGPIEDALDDAAGLPPAQRERLDVAHRNALRLLKLVNSLLDFARIEAGRTRARFEPTALDAVTADLASTFRSACERAGLALVVDCPPLPEPVHVDRDMWEKVVLNLVSNAFKFTLQGRIAVALHARGDTVELTVADTGVGIPEAEAPRVFERFHRIEGQGGRTHEGTGIGLALVAELAKLHGGTAAVESRLGEGSTFRVTIPRGTAHLPRDHVTASAPLAPTTVQAGAFVAEALRWLPDDGRAAGKDDALAAAPGSPRVVLADDNADMRAYVRRLLEAGGYVVEAVENGRAALEAVRRGPPPDLVLSDVMMPELDGFELLAELRADPALEGLLVVLLSARAGEEARLEGLAAGADDYLVKPFSARELRARIDGAIRLSRQRREAGERERRLGVEIAEARSQAALRQSELRLELAMQAARLGGWEQDLATGELTPSDHLRAILGVAAHEPFASQDHLAARVHPDDRRRRREAIEHAVASAADLEVEYRVQRPDGQVRWILERGRAAYDNGVATRLAGVSLDITERKDAEAHLRLVLDELNHRVKNTLATVQSIASQTLRHTPDPLAFSAAFLERIYALARAHEMLSDAAWQGASLADVIDRTLAVHTLNGESGEVTLGGPAVNLGPTAAVTLNMAFHELATNATKYGALSQAGGRIAIDWGMDEPGAIIINWRESGGPPVSVPSRRGFGSRLIEQGLTRELGGEAQMTFLPDGLWCRLRLPLSSKLSVAA
ncbi:ATP-binding protein [Phenylobacterium sp.]|jgi:PAS domain S-box-containing protein|uniref:ATP-binding protein n=1 Tax=Phenylobacterium sp. TaxID=1871053 RepID=UPI002F3E5E8A